MKSLLYIGIGGFLLGAFLYSGYYATKYEPEIRKGYIICGVGITISVVINVWLDFLRDQSDWFRAITLLSYLIVAIGLIVIVRARRGERNKNAKSD